MVNGFGTGNSIDETLQIMSMIKMGIPNPKIYEALEKIPSKGTVISYLSAFIHPEILYEIEACSNMKAENKSLAG